MDEAKKTANDLSGLVRKKKAASPVAEAPAPSTSNGKRKANDEELENGDAKKAKTEETVVAA